jgi:hypothetical protein
LKPEQETTFRIVKDAVLPITITSPVASARGAAGGSVITISAAASAAAAASSSPTDIILNPQQQASFAKGALVQAHEDVTLRVTALSLDARITGLPERERNLWSKLVFIAGFDPYVAYRIVCDGAHDYGSLIKTFYTNFLVGTVHPALMALAPGSGRTPLTVENVLNNVLTSPSDRGGGFNAKADAIALILENLNSVGAGNDPQPLEGYLVSSGMRNGPEGSNCTSVCESFFSFGSLGMAADSITFNILPHLVEAANKQSVRAICAQTLPNFMDAAGTPTEDTVALHGGKFVNLIRDTLESAEFQCDVSTFREFGPRVEGNPESFTVYNFYGDS